MVEDEKKIIIEKTWPSSSFEEEDEEDEEEEGTEEECEGSDDALEKAVLKKLQRLHHRLAAVRGQHESGAQEHAGALVNEHNKIIVCSNRRPVKIDMSDRGEGWNYTESTCSFMAGMRTIAKHNKLLHVSWPGVAVDEAGRDGVALKLESDFSTVPVFLSSELQQQYWHGFCRQSIWPLFHSLPTAAEAAMLEDFNIQYQAYCQVNQLYLEAVTREYEEGDLVIVYDFPLMSLPSLLRRRFSDITCCFVLKSPFPDPEFYRMLPVRQSLLLGMLGADLILFQSYTFCRHFQSACVQLLGLPTKDGVLQVLHHRNLCPVLCPFLLLSTLCHLPCTLYRVP